MKFNKIFIAGSMLAASVAFSSCVGDLDVKPINPNDLTELTTKEDYLGLVARAYGGLVMEGGITVDDGGAGVYMRQLFNQEVLPTDECVIGLNWNDAGIDELTYAQPSADNHWIYEMYSRINYQIALCNAVMQSLENSGSLFTGEEKDELKAEMRILRDLSYYHMIDIFGKGPWTNENSVVGDIPPTYSRTELFNAVVEDLKDAIEHVNPASQQEYGRVSKEAGLALLAKLYLNAEVYTGTPMWQECADVCQQITASIPNLAATYKYLFCASNKKYVASSTYGTANGEILWAVPQDNQTMQCWGNTTYLTVGAYATDSPAAVYGCNAGVWNGPHMRPETVKRFDANDARALFYEGEFTLDLFNIDTWGTAGTCGYMCVKFVMTEEGDHYTLSEDAADSEDNPDYQYLNPNDYSSVDWPVFRLADIYLMLAECQLHGVSCDGLNYYNKVRQRAGVTSVGSYTAQDLLDERNRELYWEGHRRSDLIRFGQYTGSTYNWQWKSGVQQGGAIESYRNLMPIPTQFTPTLGQNPGY